jgi:hypothetical protein
MLRHIGESRSVDTYTADALKVWESQYRSGKLPLNVE